MKMMKKTAALLLALVLCMSMALTAVAETAEAADKLFATVNGTEVYESEVQDYMMRLSDYYSQQGYNVTSAESQAALREMSEEAVVQMAVMKQKAAELGFDQISEEELAAITAEVEQEWNEMVDMYAVYFVASDEPTEEDLANARLQSLALLESAGYTQEAILADTLDNIWYEKLTAYMVEGAAVTEEDVAAAYEQMVAEDQAYFENNIELYEQYTVRMGYESYYTPEGYRGIRHILLAVDEGLMNTYNTLAAQLEEQIEAVEAGTGETAEGPVTQADVDAAEAAIIASVQPTIDEIYAKLADGVSFSDLIAEYGTDPGMTQEPQKTLGYNVHMNSTVWVPVFTKGGFSEKMNKVGDVSDPVVSNFGVHILEYTRDVPAGAVPLTDELRASMMDELIANAEAELFNAKMEVWMNEAEIVYAE